MSGKESSPGPADDLRLGVETPAGAEVGNKPETLSPAETQRLLQELQIRQIALQKENEELRRAQVELETSWMRYFDLYDLGPVGYCTLSKQGLILEANITAATLLGVTRDVLLNQLWARYLLPADQFTYYRHRKTLLETGTPQLCEIRMHGSTPAPFWAQLELTKAPDSTGVEEIHVVLSDITARKQGEAALWESADNLRTVLRMAMDGFWTADMQGHLLEVNETYCRMSGYLQRELLAMRISDLEVVDRDQETAAHMQRIMVQGEDRFESRHRRKDGSLMDVEISVQYQPATGRHMSFIRDITERKRAEVELRESNLRFRQVIDNIQEVFWMTDVDLHTMIYVSPVYEKVWGRTCASLYQNPKTWIEAIHPDDRPRVVAILDRRTGGDFDIEYRIHRPDGAERWIWDRGYPVQDASGKVHRITGIAEDITERRHSQRLLEQYQNKLRALANQVMTAEEQERRRLAVDLHDGPCQILSVARMRLGPLLRSMPEPRSSQTGQEIVQMLEQATQAMRSLIMELSPPILYELGLVAAAQWLADDMHARYGLQVSVIDEQQFELKDNRINILLFRCLRELLMNVVKHAHTQVAFVVIQSGPDGIRLLIEDEGKGFKTQGVGEGNKIKTKSGFGLFSIQERLSNLGGRMDIQSTPRKGTKITLTVPVKAIPREKGKRHEHPHSAG